MTLEQTIQAQEIMMPKSIHLKEIAGGLEFEGRWFKYKYLALLVMTPVLGWFLINSPYVKGSINEPTINVVIIAIGCLFAIYYALARILNATKIIVTNDQIRVLHGPVPLLKNLIIKKENVAQLYVTRQNVFHHYYRIFTSYQVNVILKNKEVITLVSKLDTLTQGHFIEQKIEYFFNIEDVPVEGEIDKKHT